MQCKQVTGGGPRAVALGGGPRAVAPGSGPQYEFHTGLNTVSCFHWALITCRIFDRLCMMQAFMQSCRGPIYVHVSVLHMSWQMVDKQARVCRAVQSSRVRSAPGGLVTIGLGVPQAEQKQCNAQTD